MIIKYLASNAIALVVRKLCLAKALSIFAMICHVCELPLENALSFAVEMISPATDEFFALLVSSKCANLVKYHSTSNAEFRMHPISLS